MTKVAVGTKNPAKIKAVQAVFSNYLFDVVSIDAPSGVSEQPMSDKETLLGSINRAKACIENTDAEYGVGLEGGVMYIDQSMYICNWGALVDRSGHEITGGGGRFKLPDPLVKGIESGQELGDVVDAYANRDQVRKKEGTVGILTNGMITRDEMFQHVVKLLVGQYQYKFGQFM